jgi:PAS domain S-box-containing protein
MMKEQEIRILHLEDLSSDTELAKYEIKKVLKYFVIRVVETEIDFLHELDEFKPHIVISDYQLPSFNGLSALKIVLEKYPLTPVIMLTGSMNEDTAVVCLKAGATDYVIKEHIKRLGPAILNAIDQTEIKIEKLKAEEALQKSEEKFRSLFENHSAVKLLIDAKTGDIVDANPAASKYYGWTIAELENLNIRNISTLSEQELLIELDNLQSHQGFQFDFIHRLKDGSLRDVEVFSSNIIIDGKEFLHSIIHDVTEKKKAEKQISLISKSLEQSPVSVIITDPSGKIQYINTKFTQITGYSFKEVVGKNPNILKSGEQSESFYKWMWQTISSGKEWSGEMHNKKKNGELYWESVVISSLVDTNGKITHYIGIKEDITERKRMVQELVAAKEKAEENERLKTAFLHNISHEIRTPMNAIVGFATLLSTPDLSEDQIYQFTETILESSNQLLMVINDIISIATIEAGQEKTEFKEINLNNLCNHVFEQFRPKAQARKLEFLIHTDLTEEQANIKIDETKLLQVLHNIIDNALKFTKTGNVTYGCKLIQNANKPSEIEFFVKDTGIGIDPEMHDEIFKRFRQVESTTTRRFGGSGLGLSISKAYIELMGGKIWIESELDKGSTFYFTIPYLQSNEIITEEIITENPITQKFLSDFDDKMTLLIAEDEDSNFMLIEHILNEQNFIILRANDGAEAVELCKTTAVDLVLMDIKMPVLDGYEATKQIRVFNADLPIIALTAYTTQIDKKNALECGCNDHISKPFRRAALINKIDEFLNKK